MASERSKRVARERSAPAPKQLPVKNLTSPEPSMRRPPEKVTPSAPAEEAPPVVEAVDYSSMTKSQIQEVLKERGITYLPQSTKRILLGILKDA